jgi:hypothetical protein
MTKNQMNSLDEFSHGDIERSLEYEETRVYLNLTKQNKKVNPRPARSKPT